MKAGDTVESKSTGLFYTVASVLTKTGQVKMKGFEKLGYLNMSDFKVRHPDIPRAKLRTV